MYCLFHIAARHEWQLDLRMFLMLKANTKKLLTYFISFKLSIPIQTFFHP